MVSIGSNLFEFDIVSQTNFLRDMDNGERDLISQQGLSVFNRKDDVVVGVVDVVESSSKAHAPILMRKTEGFRTFLQGATRQSREVTKRMKLRIPPEGELQDVLIAAQPQRNMDEEITNKDIDVRSASSVFYIKNPLPFLSVIFANSKASSWGK